MFQLPALVLSVLIATILSALFYAWQGKTARNLAVFWVAGVLGFLAGQWLAIYLEARVLVIGQIHLLEGCVLCVAAQFLVKLLKI